MPGTNLREFVEAVLVWMGEDVLSAPQRIGDDRVVFHLNRN